ncbi:MAG: hypothetical protein KF689_12365 [Gemmatimonadaceae bacterium]|nr:hypothetical protein [Gemmatimonadaceae bacterium]MCW5827225.1 hypothetical protein [Gemmatimonadaceae bacterium]
MAGIKLDGAGTQKMKTIEEALGTVQTIHGLVERMAVDVKNNRGVGAIPGQIKRIGTNLQGQLKAQFGLIADQVSAMIIAMGRGGGEQAKVRVLREAVAQLRTALEINAAKVKEQHAVKIEVAPD